MSFIKEKVDRFLLQFSYSIKIKSIIFISAAVAIFIAIMLVFSQYKLVNSVNQQQFGVVYRMYVNTLLEKVLLYKETSDPAIKNDINNLFALLEVYNREANLIMDDFPKNELNYKFKTILNNWGKVNSDYASQVKIVEAIRELNEFICFNFQLYLSFDTGLHYLLETLAVQFPEIQILSSEIISLADNPSLLEQATLINLKEELKNNLERLQTNIGLAERDNQFVRENFSNAITSIKSYIHVTEKFLNAPSSDLLKQVLISGDEAQKILTSRTELLLDRQSKTLYLRQNYGVGFIIFGVCVVLAAYTTRLIRRPVATIRDAAEQLALSNMGARISVHAYDEVGMICETFNQLVDQIEKITHDANDITSKLAFSSKSIIFTAEQLESNIVQQEKTITHIASNAKGVSRTVQDFARSLQEVGQSVAITAHLASLGHDSLSEMENVMHQMAKASMSIVKTLSELQDKIGAINDVISTIVRIADQSNLLSLNTAIRAGKPGTEHLGFSIIADKISELADQIALATLDIEDLVKNIIQMVTKSVLIVDKFSDHIRNQVYDATEIGDQLKKLIGSSQEQFEIFESVNQGMQKQTGRAAQIHETINLLNQSAQNTTQSIRNLYLEIEYLHHSTNNLQKMTKKLTEDSYKELDVMT